MNKQGNCIKYLLIVEFLLAASAAVLLYTAGGMRSGMLILSKPFEAAAFLLRSLSLSGPAGNVIAIALYVLLSLLPFIGVLKTAIRHTIGWPELLLPLLSAFCFYLLYAFINPSTLLLRVRPEVRDAEMLPVLKGCAAAVFYSLLIGYAILKALRSLVLKRCGGQEKNRRIASGLAKLLSVCLYAYTAAIGYFGCFRLFTGLDAAQGSTDFIFTLIDCALRLIPDLFAVGIVYLGLKLAVVLKEGLFEQESAAAGNLASFSRAAVYTSVISNLVWNLLQFLFAGNLSRTEYHVEIPALSLILAFAALLLSGYFKKAKELKDDNEMII